ncbi:hypothetical protein IJK16_01110 [Candidatus Saccharibacteria bacterium]|nr:hypothetical protein [Candidatus Saccharibacteria bacterium]
MGTTGEGGQNGILYNRVKETYDKLGQKEIDDVGVVDNNQLVGNDFDEIITRIANNEASPEIRLFGLVLR